MPSVRSACRSHELCDGTSRLTASKASGLTIVLAEQNLGFVSGLGDRVCIIEKGIVRYLGAMADFLADDAVRKAYLAI